MGTAGSVALGTAAMTACMIADARPVHPARIVDDGPGVGASGPGGYCPSAPITTV